jgi:hypothetical protein
MLAGSFHAVTTGPGNARHAIGRAPSRGPPLAARWNDLAEVV